MKVLALSMLVVSLSAIHLYDFVMIAVYRRVTFCEPNFFMLYGEVFMLSAIFLFGIFCFITRLRELRKH